MKLGLSPAFQGSISVTILFCSSFVYLLGSIRMKFCVVRSCHQNLIRCFGAAMLPVCGLFSNSIHSPSACYMWHTVLKLLVCPIRFNQNKPMLPASSILLSMALY